MNTYMGVDVGRVFHVVVLAMASERMDSIEVRYTGICESPEDLDVLMREFGVLNCVIDGQPELHLAREFAGRHGSKVHRCYFVESQRGGARWDDEERRVDVNRTEALDASRAVIREGKAVVRRDLSHLQEFAQQMSHDAKVVEEKPETGARSSRYVKTGVNHFSLAFTYAYLATQRSQPGPVLFAPVRQRDSLTRWKRELGIADSWGTPGRESSPRDVRTWKRDPLI